MTLVCSSFLSGCCSKHKLDSTGDKGSLCFTPLRIVISTPMSSLVLNDVLWPSYNQFSMNSNIGVGTPVLAKQGFSAEWGTVSNALEIYSQLWIAPPHYSSCYNLRQNSSSLHWFYIHFRMWNPSALDSTQHSSWSSRREWSRKSGKGNGDYSYRPSILNVAARLV